MESFLVAPLRLCAFALKLFCLLAVCKDWPAARTGAKGQRPTQGRAGFSRNSTPRRKVAKTQPDSTADDADNTDGKGIGVFLCTAIPQPRDTPRRFWTAVAERSSDTAFGRKTITVGSCDARPCESGVALRFPPQSKNLVAPLRLCVFALKVFLHGDCPQGPGQKANGHRKTAPGPDWSAFSPTPFAQGRQHMTGKPVRHLGVQHHKCLFRHRQIFRHRHRADELREAEHHQM